MLDNTSQNIEMERPYVNSGKSCGYNSVYAAAGQLGLMSLYDTLFQQVCCSSLFIPILLQIYMHIAGIAKQLLLTLVLLQQMGVYTSQVLVTEADFRTKHAQNHIKEVLFSLIRLGVVPIMNENDAISGNRGYEDIVDHQSMFSDNDGLAALVSEIVGADLLIILSNVDGVYTGSPGLDESIFISTYDPLKFKVSVGPKSAAGRGGMGDKIRSAEQAIKGGVHNVVIANGNDDHAIEKVISGELFGTLFVPDPQQLLFDETLDGTGKNMKEKAMAAREGMRALGALTYVQRSLLLTNIADALLRRTDEILAANAKDLDLAKTNNISPHLIKRLKLTCDKIKVLADGIKSLASMEEPIGRCLSKIEISPGLQLKQVTSPIGVLMIIFESRPDCLPQITALAIRSGNGLLLKGGKEAEHSCNCLHGIILDVILESTEGTVPPGVVGLVKGRQAAMELLKNDDLIDLVIPRGSKELVTSIKNSTRISVLGHAEGICHIYIDKDADMVKACKIIIDSKMDYPAACNAAETLLFHEDILRDKPHILSQSIQNMQSKGIVLKGGPKIIKNGLLSKDQKVKSFKEEYGDNTMSVELVSSLESAIDHIHMYGSGHTETIVTENKTSAQRFIDSVDSACVFHNTSTRFSDGYRFGLGCEVGISTGRIHSRGPVGVEGLLTTKWVMQSEDYHIVGHMGTGPGKKAYSHVKLEPSSL